MTARITHWINGKDWDGVAERTGEVYDPATGEVRAHVDFAGPSEIEAAVANAKEAFAKWRDTSLTARQRVLFAFRRLLDERKQELAEIITSEHGKVIDDALGEIARGIESVDFACGIPAMLKGGFSENVSTNVDVYSLR